MLRFGGDRIWNFASALVLLFVVVAEIGFTADHRSRFKTRFRAGLVYAVKMATTVGVVRRQSLSRVVLLA